LPALVLMNISLLLFVQRQEPWIVKFENLTAKTALQRCAERRLAKALSAKEKVEMSQRSLKCAGDFGCSPTECGASLLFLIEIIDRERSAPSSIKELQKQETSAKKCKRMRLTDHTIMLRPELSDPNPNRDTDLMSFN